ncbi:predicted protein [Plenodomus lingam JN3]|uniref:Predicted protein n=2 Tax=Leptosphaeria maculans TaxID=5022 RepID=E4ZMJ3_LEPMJ|nr:predicted protein [Plenodomus lingam JN3]CBX92862.1 predicted protein [Plenodomus lingam JN3]
MDPKTKKELAASVKLMTNLKPLIISEARAIFGINVYSPGMREKNVDVVVDKGLYPYSHHGLLYVYKARLIVYNPHSSLQWRLLMTSEAPCKSAEEAMADLFSLLQRHAYVKRNRILVGDECRGEAVFR